MILGARVHDFGTGSADELAAKIAAKGLRCVQLALAKAITDVDTGLGRLNPGLANTIGSAFKNHQLQIAVLGCYVNLIHPDRDERRKLLSRFKEHIRFARDFGCSIVGTETGSMNADYSFNPENHGEPAFQTLLESVAELVAEAEKFGVFVCIEGVAKHVVHTPEKMKRVLDTIPSSNLQVIFDPVNYLTIDNYRDQDRMMQTSFELFGDKIQILHAKDFVIEGDRIKTAPAGKGMLNYPLLVKLIKSRKPYLYSLLEDTKPEFLEDCQAFIEKLYQETV